MKTQRLPHSLHKKQVYLQSRARLFNKLCEGGGVIDGEVGEHLAVYRDVRSLEAVDERAVGDAVHAGGGVDTDYPQLAEVTLLELAACEGARKRVQVGFAGAAVDILLAAPKTLRDAV